MSGYPIQLRLVNGAVIFFHNHKGHEGHKGFQFETPTRTSDIARKSPACLSAPEPINEHTETRRSCFVPMHTLARLCVYRFLIFVSFVSFVVNDKKWTPA